jgi:hypothetical protein
MTITAEDIVCLRHLRQADSTRSERLPASSLRRLCEHGLLGRNGAGGFSITRGGARYLRELRPLKMARHHRRSIALWSSVGIALTLLVVAGSFAI